MANSKDHIDGWPTAVNSNDNTDAPSAARATRKAIRTAICICEVGDHVALDESLRSYGWVVNVANDSRAAVELVRSDDHQVGIVVLSSVEQVDWIKQICNHPNAAGMEWIALVTPAALEVQAIRQFIATRCFDFYTLPIDLDRLAEALGHAQGMARLAQVKPWDGSPSPDEPLVAESGEMRRVLRAVEKAAPSDLPVLIGGESGTGKEQVALMLHARSHRAKGPFVPVNCAGLAPSLVQSELFGHEKGAFTGAHRRRIGRIEAASGGTILLDEVGDLPADVQVSLLRFLEERTIERVGATESIKVDARVLAATHMNLEDAVERGEFREDLYYRLNVLSIQLPPLRRRPDDLIILAEQFLSRLRLDGGIRPRGFSAGAVQAMRQHSWPGNVRELLNRVQQAAVMSEGRLITRNDLHLEQRRQPRHLRTLKGARDSAERRAIMTSLEWSDGNVTRAAGALGVSRNYLYNLLQRHRLRSRSDH